MRSRGAGAHRPGRLEDREEREGAASAPRSTAPLLLADEEFGAVDIAQLNLVNCERPAHPGEYAQRSRRARGTSAGVPRTAPAQPARSVLLSRAHSMVAGSSLPPRIDIRQP